MFSYISSEKYLVVVVCKMLRAHYITNIIVHIQYI